MKLYYIPPYCDNIIWLIELKCCNYLWISPSMYALVYNCVQCIIPGREPLPVEG